MAISKLRMRVGGHEFEAEGTETFVQSERHRFEALVKSLPPSEADVRVALPLSRGETAVQKRGDSDEERYRNIFKVDGQGILSLSAKLPGENREPDAIVLLLFGYHQFLAKETVSGETLKLGMKNSGYPTQRVDRTMGRYGTDGTIIISGKPRRGRLYRLSGTSGMARGRQLAEEMLKLLG